MWKILAGISTKQRADPEYYLSLSRLYDESFSDFANIINLDVKRTFDAMKCEESSRKMNRILLNYAKLIRVDH